MTKFLVNLLLFSFLTVAIVVAIGEAIGCIIQTTGNNILNNADYKVNEAIMRSKQRIRTKHLILGESVGNQIYGNYADSNVYSLTASVAVTDVGEYLLLVKFLDVNRDQLPEDVTMIYNPFCWSNVLTGGLFYSTFMKNFYNKDFKSYMDDELKNHLDQFPLSCLCEIKAYQYSPYMPDVKHITQETEPGISPIQYKYLKKTKEICDKYDIKFRLASGPIRESRKEEVMKIRKSNEIFMDSIFHDYFLSLSFWSDENFIDALHLKNESVPRDYLHFFE